MRELLHSAAIPAPKFRYTPCVRSGPWYSVSGMVGLDPASGTLVAGGLAAQARQILRNLQAAMPDYGVGWEHMVAARIYTTEFERFAEINQVWEECFATVAPPARTAVGVWALPLGAAIEIEFNFYRESPA
ncbi:RidA family protein [Alicycliphilus denitrificans]|uniref:RidA family protein n=1 Tax=Alicycliphilus denitrificans TaxID=179636 RepID=A0A420KFP6_9BURK|nr:RidA family protein [Alicycliphilus denitrificans]RKJ98761.1 RidA family protein [Alicycliphilus denitrificans]